MSVLFHRDWSGNNYFGHFLPLIQQGKYVHYVLVNHLEVGVSLLRNSVSRLTDLNQNTNHNFVQSLQEVLSGNGMAGC